MYPYSPHKSEYPWVILATEKLIPFSQGTRFAEYTNLNQGNLLFTYIRREYNTRNNICQLHMFSQLHSYVG